MDDVAANKHFEFGVKNPSLMEKPFWKYMVCNPLLTSFDCYRDSPLCHKSDRLPIWCFARFGATQTYLPDGRLIRIAGEHEDSYDPDFQIYNDVVVINNPQLFPNDVMSPYAMPVPSNFPEAKAYTILRASNVNDVTIYGYPHDVFPRTDTHTATYVRCKDENEYIYIIGGYNQECECAKRQLCTPSCFKSRHDDKIRVFRLCLSDFSIQEVETFGEIPRGCTSDHSSKLIVREGRQIIEINISRTGVRTCFYQRSAADPSLTDWGVHHQFYRLDVETGVWTILKRKQLKMLESSSTASVKRN